MRYALLGLVVGTLLGFIILGAILIVPTDADAPPAYTLDDVIAQQHLAMDIHQQIVDNPGSYDLEAVGDVAWHRQWVVRYAAAIDYLNQLKGYGTQMASLQSQNQQLQEQLIAARRASEGCLSNYAYMDQQLKTSRRIIQSLHAENAQLQAQLIATRQAYQDLHERSKKPLPAQPTYQAPQPQPQPQPAPVPMPNWIDYF